MDIQKELNGPYSKGKALAIADYVSDTPARFAKFMTVFLQGDYRTSQRAAWALSFAAESNPRLIVPHLSRLLKFAGRADSNDAVKRNVMRILQFVEVPAAYHGEVIDLAFRLLQDRTQPIAIRVFSMTVIERFVMDTPELMQELKIIIEDEMPYGSAAFRSRGSKLLSRINKTAKTVRTR